MRSILRCVKRACQFSPLSDTPTDPLRVRVCALAFRMLYGPAARIYDRFTGWLFLGEWRRWQETVVPYLPDAGVVVELGCGTGDFASRFATPRRRWFAIESSPAMLAVAGPMLRGSNARLVRGDARALPFRPETADLVVATFPAGYILDPYAWREIRRVLKPDGGFVVVATGRLRPTCRSRRWRIALLDLAYGGRGSDSAALDMGAIVPASAWRWVPTAHGDAQVLAARREVINLSGNRSTAAVGDQEDDPRVPAL